MRVLFLLSLLFPFQVESLSELQLIKFLYSLLEMTKRKRSQDRLHSTKGRVWCSHCNQMLAKRTFFKHKSAYFNQHTRKWKQSAQSDETGLSLNQEESRLPHNKRKRCGHCFKVLSVSNYYRHKRLFYNDATKEWMAKEVNFNNSKQQHFLDIHGSGSSSEEYESQNLLLSHHNATETDTDQSLFDSEDDQTKSEDRTNIEGSESESDESSCEEDDGPEYVDADSEDMFESALNDDLSELPEPAQHFDENQRSKIILTWLIYFILIWQYKNYVSDNAIEQLLKFFQQLFYCFGTIVKQYMNLELFLVLATNIPTTLYSARKLLKIDRDCFEKYVVCPKCTKLYSLNEILFHSGQETVAKTCSHVAYPRARSPKVCGAQLAQKVILTNGATKFYAIKTYCYRSIIDSLEDLLKRPGLEEECEKWRTRNVGDDLYADVFDGKVWKDFQRWKNRKDFLNVPHSYGLMLNVDWFKPFKHRNDCSVGVMYMVLMNLPRHLRFKKENVILVGIIPALKKEPSSLNHFLEPAVNELKALWNGVNVHTFNNQKDAVKIQAALLCCSADIPAARKLCGFLGHQANRGCSHCYKFFPGGFQEKKDYSGFEDRNLWPKRTAEQHHRDAMRVKNCRCKTIQEKLESKLGCKYTVLLELPYYSSVTMCVIDPMHNLFLGTAKRVFTKWLEQNIITKADLSKIQDRIEEICATSDLGRLPSNIQSNHGGYTAGQWKHFVLLYSMYVLKDVLPENDMHCWQSFVLACRLLCKPCITKTDLMIADNKFMHFLKEYESLYGKSSISPNMHLHAHLMECVENYGSIYGFWLFSFERYNGILGAYHNNNRTVEIQIMRKFMTSGILSGMQYCLPKEYEEFFHAPCLSQLDSALSTTCQVPVHLLMASTGSLVGKESVWGNLKGVLLCESYKLASLENDDSVALRSVYLKLYSNISESSLKMATLYKKYSSVNIYGEDYGSEIKSRLRRYGRVMASWCNMEGELNPGQFRPGLVRHYMMHSVEIEGKQHIHVFAVVKWLKPAPTDFGYGNPISVWHAKEFDGAGPCAFLPIQRIHSRFVCAEKLYLGQRYTIVSPVCARILV